MSRTGQPCPWNLLCSSRSSWSSALVRLAVFRLSHSRNMAGMSRYTKLDLVRRVNRSVSHNMTINSVGLDTRLPSFKAVMQQRSINLAVSSRGIAALACVDSDAADRILSTAIPLRGRMIHHQGRLAQHIYDIDGQVSGLPRFPINL
jgi:hypothetical protein